MAKIELERMLAVIDPGKMEVLHAVSRGGAHEFAVSGPHDEILAALESAGLVTTAQTSIEGRPILFVLPTFAGWKLAALDTRAEAAPVRMIRRRAEKRGERVGADVGDLIERLAGDGAAPLDADELGKLQALGLVDRSGHPAPVALELGEMARGIRDLPGRERAPAGA